MTKPRLILAGDSVLALQIPDLRELLGDHFDVIDCAQGGDTIASTRADVLRVKRPGDYLVFLGAHKDVRSGHAGNIIAAIDGTPGSEGMADGCADVLVAEQETNYAAAYEIPGLYEKAGQALAIIGSELAGHYGRRFFPWREALNAAVKRLPWTLDAEDLAGIDGELSYGTPRGLPPRRLRVPGINPLTGENSNTGHPRKPHGTRIFALVLAREILSRWAASTLATKAAVELDTYPEPPQVPSELTPSGGGGGTGGGGGQSGGGSGGGAGAGAGGIFARFLEALRRRRQPRPRPSP